MSEEESNTQKGGTFSFGFFAGAAFAALVFILKGALEPTIEEFGERIKGRVFSPGDIFITACAPLESAHNIFRVFDSDSQNELLLVRDDAEAINRTMVQIFNMTGEDLTDVRISMKAFFENEKTTDYAYSSMATNGLDASQRFEVGEDGRGGRQISIDNLADDEGIFLEGVVYGPMALHMELKSNEAVERRYFPSGCADGMLEITTEPLYTFYEKATEICGGQSEGGGGGFTCKEEVNFPEDVVPLFTSGASVEITREKNGEVIDVMVHEARVYTPGPITVDVESEKESIWDISKWWR